MRGHSLLCSVVRQTREVASIFTPDDSDWDTRDCVTPTDIGLDAAGCSEGGVACALLVGILALIDCQADDFAVERKAPKHDIEAASVLVREREGGRCCSCYGAALQKVVCCSSQGKSCQP